MPNVNILTPGPKPITARAGRWVEGSALGVVAVGLATVPKWLFIDSIGRPTPFLLYILPILLATFRGGWVAGVLTTCVATGAGSTFQSVQVDGLAAVTLRVVIFGAQALLFVYLIDRFTRERQRARRLIEDVSQTRDRLNGILLGTADGIIVYDSQGRCVFANESAAHLLGRSSAEDLIATPHPELAATFELTDVQHQPYPASNSPSRVALRTGQIAEDVMGLRSLISPDAPVRWARVRANPILDDTGGVTSVVALFYDVTEARRREEALALAHEWFQIALKSIGDAVITTDEQGKVNMVNRVAEVLLGKPATELHHHPIRDVFQVFGESGGDPLPDPVERVLSSGAAAQVANPAYLRRADGRDIPVDSNAAPIRDRDGNLRGVILVFRDVSAQRIRERQQALLTSVSQQLNSSLDYRANLQAAADACVPLLGDWCSIDLHDGENWNRVVATSTNSEEVHTDMPAVCSSHREDAEPRTILSDRLISIPLAKGPKHLGVLSLALAGSGRAYSVDDHAVAVNLADRIAAAVENARLFEATNAAREQAIAADRTKSDFLAMLGHELRNPLAPIQTALDVLRLNKIDATDAEEFQIIDRQLRHLGRLVDDLLDVSRITHGRVELNREVVEVANVIEQARGTVWPAGTRPSHRLHVEATSDLRVVGDPIRLAQVLTNLMINSCKYSAPGSHIWIRAVEHQGSAVITIRDEGIGIGPEMLRKVFDTFVQEPQAIDRSRGGLGLGLSIVQGLVNAHGGRVSAQSDGVGKGSTFEVQLPAWVGSPEAEKPSAKVAHPSRVKRRILVVDDNVDAADVMAKLLNKVGHTVFVANNPNEAIAIVSREVLDIALLDIGLPEMSGYELGRRLRAMTNGEQLPLVALTGYGQVEDHERSRREGFLAHLVKPVTLDDLQETLGTLP